MTAIDRVKAQEVARNNKDLVKAGRVLNSIATLKPPALSKDLQDIIKSMPTSVTKKGE